MKIVSLFFINIFLNIGFFCYLTQANDTLHTILEKSENQNEEEWINLVLETISILGEENNLNDRNELGQTPLHLAIQHGYDIIFAALLTQESVNIHILDNLGRSPLHIAAQMNRIDVAKLLLERLQASSGNQSIIDYINTQDSSGQSAFQIALHNGYYELGRMFLQFNNNTLTLDADPDSIFRMACFLNDTEIISRLTSANSHLTSDSALNINNQDNLGQTGLHIAIKIGYVALVNRLLDLNANILVFDARLRTPFHLACIEGRYTITKNLLKAIQARYLSTKGNCNNSTIINDSIINDFKLNEAINPKGIRIVHVVAINGNLDILDLLYTLGVEFNVADHQGETPLHSFINNLTNLTYDIKDIIEILKLLVEKGKLASKRDNQGQTALHLVIQNYNRPSFLRYRPYIREIIAILASQDTINVADNNGQTALHIAAGQGSLEIVNLLITQGADPTLQNLEEVNSNPNQTPLHSVIENLHNFTEPSYARDAIGIARTLLSHGLALQIHNARTDNLYKSFLDIIGRRQYGIERDRSLPTRTYILDAYQTIRNMLFNEYLVTIRNRREQQQAQQRRRTQSTGSNAVTVNANRTQISTMPRQYQASLSAQNLVGPNQNLEHPNSTSTSTNSLQRTGLGERDNNCALQ